MFQILPLGGYSEIGRNCTAIRYQDQVIILDMGLHMENYIRLTQEADLFKISTPDLKTANAIPDLSPLADWKPLVKAIIPSHGHLDHVGALPFLANQFDCPILAAPYTIEIIRTNLREEKLTFKNPLKTLNVNSKIKISPNLEIEFINITHSIPQTVMIALHTPSGTLLYANDFKFDPFPTLGQKPDFERLRQLQGHVTCLIMDSLYASRPGKTPSESVAKQMLRDVLLGTDTKGKTIIATTFASHLARLKSILQMAQLINRKPVFLGRSLYKYITAAEHINLVNFSSQAKILGFSDKIKKALKKISQKPQKYLLITTGHQGEPGSVLSRLATQQLKFPLEEAHIIFSCSVIPAELNIKNRQNLEKNLLKFKTRLFKDIHVSGHCSHEDLHDLITLTQPQHLIPSHAEPEQKTALSQLAQEIGYKKEQIHLLKDTQKITLT